MSDYRPKPDTGSMWTPMGTRTDKSPRWRGQIVLSPELIALAQAGEAIEIAAWESETKNGQEYLSLKLSRKWKPPENGDRPQRDRSTPRSNAPIDEEEAPF